MSRALPVKKLRTTARTESQKIVNFSSSFEEPVRCRKHGWFLTHNKLNSFLALPTTVPQNHIRKQVEDYLHMKTQYSRKLFLKE